MSSEATRAADTVVLRLTERIRSGAYLPGQRLPAERQLMDEFQVSRTVIREAVQTLSRQGLVRARPRHRPVVAEPGYETAVGILDGLVDHLLRQPDGVGNLFDTRVMVEAMLARHAARDAGREDIAALKAALAANRAEIEDSEAFYRTDMAFHALLYRIPRNPVYPAVHKAYVTWLAPQWSRMPRAPERNRRNYEGHRRLFDAILMRDPDAAEAALRAHLSDAWTQLQETYGEP